MIILHIASIGNEKFSGTNIVIPQYINYQQDYAKVHLVNLNSDTLDGLKDNQYTSLKVTDKIEDLRYPYNNPDLVVIHGIYELKIVIFCLRNIISKYRYIAVPHGGLSTLSQKKSKVKKRLANLMFYKSYFKHALAVQFLSDAEKEKSIKYYKNFIVAGNGIDCDKCIKYEEKFTSGLNIVYVGRLEKIHKGVDLMVEAFNYGKEFFIENNISLVLYGVNYGNTCRELDEYIVKHQLCDIVSVNDGGVYGDEKKEILLNSDFFIQTSRSEGLSLGVLEVLSLGIPVIVTDGVGINELVDNNKCGFLCRNTAESIAESIKKAYESKLIGKISVLSHNAYEVSKLFDWNIVTRNTVKKYEEITNESKSKL